MTKKSMKRLLRDAWKKKDLERLMELAEVSPLERKEIEEKIREYGIK